MALAEAEAEAQLRNAVPEASGDADAAARAVDTAGSAAADAKDAALQTEPEQGANLSSGSEDDTSDPGGQA